MTAQDETCIMQSDTSLQTAIKSLSDEIHNQNILAKVKICMEYMTTLSISEVDAELFQWVMPPIRKSLQKIFQDNLLLSDTADDEFVVDILKQNLCLALDFIKIVKIILEFLLEKNEIRLNDIKNVTSISVQVILSVFDHCKHSSDAYKDTFSMALLEIFQTTQEVHALYLQLLESCIVLENLVENNEEKIVFKEVLDTICIIGELLSDLNMKSMTLNWKGYTGIAQKFSDILIEYIDIKQPFHCLTSEIVKNLSAIDEMETINPKLAIQIIRKTGFLVKVTLKLLEIFWNCVENITEELLIFCCFVYSYPPDLFGSQGYPEEILELVNSSIFASLEPFISRLVINDGFLKSLSTQNISIKKIPFGFLNFMNAFLKCVTEKESVVLLDKVLRLIFDYTKQCFEEFFSSHPPSKTIFDRLVVNISAAVISHGVFYGEIESILLENILQEHVWCALLAMDVWCLILGKSTPQFRSETFSNLLRIYEQLDFGMNTYRLENIYLRCFIRRVLKNLPGNEAIEIMRGNDKSLWRIVGFENHPEQSKNVIERVCTSTVEKIEGIGGDSFYLEDFVDIVENLELLSSANFQDMGPNSKNLLDAIGIFWESSYEHLSNNVFKYFINKLCKITRTLISEFSNRQLFMILNQLKVLSNEDCFQIYVCDILSSLSLKNTNEFGQDKFKIFSLISCIIHPALITSSNAIIKQNALELIEKYVANDKEDVVRGVIKTSDDVKTEVVRYLQKDVSAHSVGSSAQGVGSSAQCLDSSAQCLDSFVRGLDSPAQRDYLRSLGNAQFVHECVKWNTTGNLVPIPKKFKLDQVNNESKLKRSPKPQRVLQEVSDCLVEDRTDAVNYAIAGVKSEVKCLMKVLKTEKLSQKNVSDLKILANQLLSLL